MKTPTRADVFIASALNDQLCDIQQAILALGVAAEEFLEANHEEQLRADLAAAGHDPEPTYQERVDLHMVRESLKAVVATMHLTYEVLARVVNANLEVVGDAPR